MAGTQLLRAAPVLLRSKLPRSRGIRHNGYRCRTHDACRNLRVLSIRPSGPSVPRMIVVAIAVGLTMTAKFTGVFIIPLLCLIAADRFVASEGRASRIPESASARQMVVAIAVASIIGVGWVWAIYHFRYAALPAPRLQLNPTSAEYLQKLTSPLSRSVVTTSEPGFISYPRPTSTDWQTLRSQPAISQATCSGEPTQGRLTGTSRLPSSSRARFRF